MNQDTNNESREKYGTMSGILGIVLNFLLFLSKFIAGAITNSVSITADAFNNLSDATASIVSFISFKVASSPADKEHPYGHGRAEYIASFVISALVIVVGVEFARTSIGKIINYEPITFEWTAVIIMCASIFVKLFMGIFNTRLSKKINSQTLKAVAADSFSDVAISLCVLSGIILFKFAGINLDSYIGVLISLFIIYNGIKLIKESASSIIGETPDDTLIKKIEKFVVNFDGILGVHDIMVHSYGVSQNIVTLHAEVSSDMDFLAAHELIDEIEFALKENFPCLATIHLDPIENNNPEIVALLEKVSGIISDVSSELSMHDFRKTSGSNRENLIFDIAVPFGFKMKDADLKKEIAKRVQLLDKKYYTVIHIDNI